MMPHVNKWSPLDGAHKLQVTVIVSDGFSRLGLGLEMRLETRFLKSRSQVSKVSGLVSVSKDFGLGLELFVSRLCINYFL